MLITLTCHTPHAPEIGYLFAKNPASVFTRPFSAGEVWAFYPEVADDHLTIALVMAVDPIGIVRGPAALAQIDQYVNDRPYVASSLTSVALRTAFDTALSGHSRERSERLQEPMLWEIAIPALACNMGEELITRIFAPLGYAVTTTRLPLDPHFPQWGQSDIYSLQLVGTQTVQAVLSHLYVLLPVLDNSKHYYVGADETEKLLAHGGAWLEAHPAREIITRRYLRHRQSLVQSALAQLAENMPVEVLEKQEEAAITPEEEQIGLHQQRLQAVMAAVQEIDAHSLADLGCGEGRLLQLALAERSLTRIFGMDVATTALTRARRRLHLDTMSPAQQARITITQGSLLYRDKRLEGFDAAALVEVIEHLDAPRLGALEQVLFAQARPRRVIITTPNREYNVKFNTPDHARLRHTDHRFEWTRAEGRAWAEHVASDYPYRFIHRELGAIDPEFGAPSQLLIFDHQDAAPQTEGTGNE